MPPVALRYTTIRSLLTVLPVTAVLSAGILLFLPESWRFLVLGILLVVVVVGTVADLCLFNRWSVRNTRYSVDASSVRIRHGRLLVRETTIATAQLLNVTVNEGPLLRHWGLARVTFTCISEVEPLGPLTVAEAESVRSRALSAYLDADDEPSAEA
ncbi:hypothetical protein BGP79_07295 [Tersicoccus sp. Bi-70]|nr:hypothetical protein BGP79_07295 [Tersicoccus sp. Bi-70]